MLIYIPGTQMTLVLFEKGLVLEGSTSKIEDKQVPGVYYIYIIYICILYSIYVYVTLTLPILII